MSASLGDKVSVYLAIPTGSGDTMLFPSNFQELFSLEKPIRTLMMLWVVVDPSSEKRVSCGCGLASPDDAWY